MYTPTEQKYNNEFKCHVNDIIKEMEIESELMEDGILNIPITSNEIKSVIKGLRTKKAPGYDLIQAECFKNGAENFVLCLTKLFNLLLREEYVPKEFKKVLLCQFQKVIRIKV